MAQENQNPHLWTHEPTVASAAFGNNEHWDNPYMYQTASRMVHPFHYHSLRSLKLTIHSSQVSVKHLVRLFPLNLVAKCYVPSVLIYPVDP
jgi:hypothetical protein